MSLFRTAAVAHQQDRLTGTITLTHPLSVHLTAVLLVAIALAILGFLFTAKYTRKETVRGFLMPNKGVIKSFANQAGTVQTLWVKEGDKVVKNQPLITLFTPSNNADGLNLNEELQQQLTLQLNLIDREISQHRDMSTQQLNNLTRKHQGLLKQQTALHQQLTLANEKLELLKVQQQKLVKLTRNGHVTTQEKDNQQHALLDTKQQQQELTRSLSQHAEQIDQVAFEKQHTPQQTQLKINGLLRRKADIQNQLSQVINNHSRTITASHSGTVTSIQVVEGEALIASTQAKPLLHILPQGAELVAELLLPTRSAGFVSKGQISRLRFDAFPYQRFGFIESTIMRIDKTLIRPNEVQLPVSLQEPVYRLRATLSNHQIEAYGKHFNLKSGMLLEADIMLEQRSLIEWLLSPIHSLKGRVS